MTSQTIRQYMILTCTTPKPKLLFLIKSLKKSLDYGIHAASSYSYSLSVCHIW